MRKLFTTLKSVIAVAVVASMTLASSCSYDDTAIKNRVDQVEQDVDKVEKDLAALTERVTALENKLDTELAALTELINGKVVVTSVTTGEDGVVTVALSDGKSFKVYPECTVEDTDTDTNTYIGIKADEGVLYFAIYEMGEFKEWLTIDGEKVPVYDGDTLDDNICDGGIIDTDTDTNDDTYVAPYLNTEDNEYYYAVLDRKNDNAFVEWYLVNGEKVAVYDGNDNTICECKPVEIQFQVNAETKALEFSIDGGATWHETGLSAADSGAQLINDVIDNGNDTVTFVGAGFKFTVVKADLIEFNSTRGHLYVKPGQTKDVYFTINTAVADVNVMNQPLGWKAEVTFAATEEDGSEGDEVDPDMGVMAAGGTELVLKITGPSQEFINAGYAEASGYITVHFNGNNGTCQVGKIAVELASITLDVDKAGNVTVTNTWIDEYLYSSWEGEQLIQEFNNYYVCIMPIEEYVEDLASIYNASWWEFDVPNVGGWINNFFYNVNEEYNSYDKATYVDGENEQWIFKATVEEIMGELDWGGTLTYEGNSFMILVIPTDPQNYGSLLLDQALAAPFKQLNVKAEVVEATWNNVYLNATLRGANAYQFNIKNKAELEQEIANGWYADVETFYSDYIFYWQNYGSQFGSHRLTQDVSAENIAFNDLINYGEEYPYLFELAPNSTYTVAILAEQDDKTEYTYEDLIFFEFTTDDIVAATTPLECTVEPDTENTTFTYIYGNVTAPEEAVAVYSRWYDEEFVDEVELKNDLVANGWMKVDFSMGQTYSVSTNVEAAGTTKYLGLLIVDAEGNYSTGWYEFKSKEVILNTNVTVTIDSVEFFAADKVCDVTLGGLDGVEFTGIKAFLADMEGYYVKDKADFADLAYADNYQYINYTTNPFTIYRTAGYKYNATEGKTYQLAVAVIFADGTVSAPVYGEFSFGEVVPPLTVVSAAATKGTANGDMNYHTVAFTMSDNSVISMEMRTNGNNYLTLGEYTDTWSYYEAEYYPGYVYCAYVDGEACYWSSTNVSYADGEYTVKFGIGAYPDTKTYTYTGAIEGLEAPVTE